MQVLFQDGTGVFLQNMGSFSEFLFRQTPPVATSEKVQSLLGLDKRIPE